MQPRFLVAPDSLSSRPQAAVSRGHHVAIGVDRACEVSCSRHECADGEPLILASSNDMYLFLAVANDATEMKACYRGGPELVEGQPGSIVHLFDLRHEWTIRFNAATVALSIRIPRSAVGFKRGMGPSIHAKRPEPHVDDLKTSIVRDLVGAATCMLSADDATGRVALHHVIQVLLSNVSAGFCSYRAYPCMPCERLAPWQEQRIQAYFTQNMRERIRAVDLSRLCGIPCSQFSQLFKNTVGTPLRRWVLEKRVERAMGLLLSRVGSIADVASEVGFYDQAHFSRIFSSVTKCSPMAWRRKHLAEPGTSS